MRMIDGDKLLARYKERCAGCKETKNYCEHCCDIADVIDDIEDAPTIEERKKGKWIVPHHDVVISGTCSCCGWDAILFETDVAGMPYCPNCGADMREEKTNED